MTAGNDPPLTYAAAGVDIDAREATVARIREIAERTRRPEVLSAVGGFAGLFRLAQYRDPVLVASADGVGTKLLVAEAVGRYDSVGRDLVHHCVNDILPSGAEPLFFLDYVGTADLPQERRVELIGGVGAACEQLGIALLGGETADLPDIYRPGVVDLAGFIVGVVEREALIDGSRVADGDALVALPSGGLQTNGYSLVRAIWNIARGGDREHDRAVLRTRYEVLENRSLGEALLAVHPCFLPALRSMLPQIHAMAHITGGGIPGNLPRMLPPHLAGAINRGTWRVPDLFTLIQREGAIVEREMWRTFNMGVGMIIAISPDDVPGIRDRIPGCWPIGQVVPRLPGDPAVRGLE